MSLAITAGQGVLWVNLANIALGVVVMVFLGVLALGVIRDFCGGWPKRTTTSLEIDPEMRSMPGRAARGHAARPA